jgi:long-chain acyl-CoA synthetase
MIIVDYLTIYSKNKNKNKNFIFCNDEFYSFKAINDLTNQCCNYFQSIKLKKKNIICIVFENSLEFVILYLASMRYGLILCPVPTYLSEEELKKSLFFIKPKFIFTYKNISSETKKKILFKDTNYFLNTIKIFSKKFKKCNFNEKQTAILYYSSGSTGKPKLIEMSHKSIFESQRLQKKSLLKSAGKRHLIFLPLFHTSSLRSSLKFCLMNGYSIYIFKNFWSIKDSILQIIKKYKITFFQTVPSVLEMMCAMFAKKNITSFIRSLKLVGVGSSYLSEFLSSKFINTFNTALLNIYGLSETCAVSMKKIENSNFSKQSVGKVLKGIKFKILDNNNIRIKGNVYGELAVKTPAIFTKYFKKKNIKKLNYKGFFKTGDIFNVNSQKELIYIERKKNIIIKSGINISSKEIDQTVMKSGIVKDVYTTSSPDIFHGEVPVTYCVLNNNRYLPILRKYLLENLGDFKLPSKFILMKKLPRSPTGKIQYSLLKDTNDG